MGDPPGEPGSGRILFVQMGRVIISTHPYKKVYIQLLFDCISKDSARYAN